MGIGETLSSGYSPPRRGGEGCGISKSREATEEAADGVVSSAKCLGLNSFAELTTPAAPISERIHFIGGAPPLLCEEGNALRPYVTVFEKQTTPFLFRDSQPSSAWSSLI